MSGNKHDGTYVRKKLFNSVEPSEIQPSFLIYALRNAVKQENQCLRPSAPFSLPFSQQTAVAHQGVPKSPLLPDAQEQGCKQQRELL